MTAVACGMAMAGAQAYTYSIGNFPTLRCLEQLRNDVCHHRADVAVVADVVAQLLQAPKRGEVADRIGVGAGPGHRHAAGHGGHVLLGDARVEIAVREARGEVGEHAEAQVAGDQDQARILGGQLAQRLDKGVTHPTGPVRAWRLRTPRPAGRGSARAPGLP